MRQMKQDGVPDVDITKAVAELKARKRTLEARVGTPQPWIQMQLHGLRILFWATPLDKSLPTFTPLV